MSRTRSTASLAAHSRGVVLRFIRRTRSRGVDQDLEENDWFRLQVLAAAHDALGRGDKSNAIRRRMEALTEHMT